MSPETLRGVLLIMGIGLAVLALAGFLDWRSAKRAERALQQVVPLPGDSVETREDEAPAAVPQYVSDEQAHRRGDLPDLSEDEAAAATRARSDGLELAAHLVDPRLRTHRSSDAMVLLGARVLCCPEGIGGVREVLSTLERAAADKTPIVLVAPTLDPEVCDLLVVNVARGSLQGGAITASAGDCLTLAEALGGHAVSRVDLQSGYLPHSAYGLASVVVVEGSSARFIAA